MKPFDVLWVLGFGWSEGLAGPGRVVEEDASSRTWRGIGTLGGSERGTWTVVVERSTGLARFARFVQDGGAHLTQQMVLVTEGCVEVSGRPGTLLPRRGLFLDGVGRPTHEVRVRSAATADAEAFHASVAAEWAALEQRRRQSVALRALLGLGK